MLSWADFPKPIIALAPMAGYTDSSYRQLAKEVCPQIVCFTEFTNIEGLLHGNDATLRQISFNPDKERPLVAQIFGKKPENFKKAAARLVEMGVDAIDINMGCPAKKIVSSDHGSAMLKNPCLAGEIVAATVEGAAGRVPVSVKTRIGTSVYHEDEFLKFAQLMEKSGAQLIIVHGRTSKQMYGGTADWNPMYMLKNILNIPVIGNGDIKSGADAVGKLQNLDGIMVGRGTFGNPWVFLDIVAAMAGKSFTPLTFEEKIPWIIRHIELSCDFKGDQWGMLEMRKHLAWYVKGMPNASEFRKKLIMVNNREEAVQLLKNIATLPA